MPPRPSLAEIFLVALRLGVTAFGGPVAHLAYFREEYVRRRHWLDEAHYADLVALCQFLPGPASSQTGFGVGYLQRGLAGGLAAWAGFTLPSTLLMIALGYGIAAGTDLGHAGWMRGLKVAAVAVVAQAIASMARQLCPDWTRRAMALVTAGTVAWLPWAWTQVAAIALGAAVGSLWLKPATDGRGGNAGNPRGPAILLLAQPAAPAIPGILWLILFAALLAGLPVVAHFTGNPWLEIFDRFYRAGALVFGGGHAVLPLLEREVITPGGLTHDQFLAGYGAVQAMPGPLFTLSAYLGTLMTPGPERWLGGAWALCAIFLPGLLLVAGVMPYWPKLRQRANVQAALRGANAVVVGILAAAFYNPVWPAGIPNRWCFVFAVIAFVALQSAKLPVWLVVLMTAVAGALWL